ncbi:glycosyltransferase family 2 protein [Patescibacteria group bacterium]|jgi:glycosyltransferase involved in cell wall biosynthesis|nr:glycosyltransferase family 2 protein [Patescibacteria group bacterium]HPD07775.1 glycosyltransferase family A protein [bacterium]HRT11101.1 glycosyltransferase family A protein [Patescibacteria group bacterium]HRU89942.1 glycosyltransferase family A protein [Patescibacteria group bacterium]
MISVIIPVYNQADKIGRCLDSLLAQTYRDFEIIIVDDGSTDNLDEVLLAYETKLQDAKIPYKIIVQENRGANAARNRGWAEAQGDFLLFSDADITWRPDALEKLVNSLIHNPQASYCYSSFRLGRKKFHLWPFDPERLYREPYIHTSALIRRADFPGFDNTLKRFQDWDLWLTMLEQGKKGLFYDDFLFTVASGGRISKWLPSFAYKIFPFLPKVKKYQEAAAVIKAKHHLPYETK